MHEKYGPDHLLPLLICFYNRHFQNSKRNQRSLLYTVEPRTMLPLGHQRCSVVQISDVQGSMFQLCASYFISINPRFQQCAIYFTSVNPRLQHCKSFFISANPRFSVLQDLSGFFGHQHYTMVSTVHGSIVQGPIVHIVGLQMGSERFLIFLIIRKDDQALKQIPTTYTNPILIPHGGLK